MDKLAFSGIKYHLANRVKRVVVSKPSINKLREIFSWIRLSQNFLKLQQIQAYSSGYHSRKKLRDRLCARAKRINGKSNNQSYKSHGFSDKFICLDNSFLGGYQFVEHNSECIYIYLGGDITILSIPGQKCQDQSNHL
jgi:hypothetical protein